MPRRLLLPWMASIAISGPLSAQDQPPAEVALRGPAAERATPRLIAETSAIGPGQTILIGVTFDMQPGWHIYWEGRNDTVPGPTIRLTAPEGFTVGPLRWPAPHRYESPGELLDHVYERRVTLLAPLTAPQTLSGDAVRLTAELEWTACSDICLMSDGVLTLDLPVAPAPVTTPGPEAARFREARQRLPQPPTQDAGVTVEATPAQLEIRVAGAARLAFYPAESGPGFVNLLEDGDAQGDALRLRLEPGGQPATGVLEVWRPGSPESSLIELRIEPGGAVQAVKRAPLPAPPGARQPSSGG